ncbi:unnamed protein product [Brachionus calyciflorus]|uniref:Sorting nexin 13 n=1 Tax=Brachionus calyciflorus TaxID=104777 RepID=A0A814AZ88_9BILA|nr:unnamed protein product [Brachionus calyciflorus]
MFNRIEKLKTREFNPRDFAKFYTSLILIHIVLNHSNKLFLVVLLCFLFLIGFLYYILNSAKLQNEFEKYLRLSPSKFKSSHGFIKVENETSFEFDLQTSPCSIGSINSKFDQKSINSLSIKPSLTGLYLVDDELHRIIDLIIRDFIDEWYKNEISGRDEFSNYIRNLIYYSIRQTNQCLKLIDWENFFTNVLAQNLVVQIRMFKKAREKLKKNQKSESINPALNLKNQSNETLFKNAQSIAQNNQKSLVEGFFDIEADFEKGICRDNLCIDLREEQDDFLQELSEMLCYCLMPSKTFNCTPLRCLIREIFSHILIKSSIDKITDPDYLNQTILYLSRNDVPSTENFITTINFCENLDELCELSFKIEREIALTRSNDIGGHDVNEIKLQLSSLTYLKRKIDAKVSNLIKKLNNLGNGASSSSTSKDQNQDDQLKNMVTNLNLESIELNTIIRNETIQHCFIEFMSKKNVQNLISFYLNADMYRQFAKKELSKINTNDPNSVKSVKESLKDFSKSLIHSYLLSASNFTAMSQDDGDQPVNISNRIYYKRELAKALESLENLDEINESILDDLQSKIYILINEKYLNDFKNSSEFHKMMLNNDIKLSPINQSNDLDEIDSFININDPSMNCEEIETIATIDNDTNNVSIDRVSLSSFDLCTLETKTNQIDSKYIKLNACITSTGRCNDLKSTYSIYILDITMLNELTGKVEYWQTYRRFNDFHDFHIILKKNFPDLKIQSLPGKSFRNSLNDDLVEKRITELNKYLKMITNEDNLKKNPDLLELVLKFLENRRWEYSSPTSLKRRFDSFLTPMISSVQTLQSSIKNAPDNVIGMVKGISDNLLSDTQNSNTSPLKQEKPLNNFPAVKVESEASASPKINRKLSETLSIDDLHSNNIPIRVIMLLMDEIFDLKIKNQWLRQSLMAIIKSFLKNFKGDSMNRKIKEQIAVHLGEESLARYLKNFRKRIWPKGYLSEVHSPRPKSSQEVTKLLVKTKLLSFVSDEFRHILGNDATRRGIFNLFEMFQQKALNKRLFYIIIENLFISLFFQSQNNPTLLPILFKIPNPKKTSQNTSNILSPFTYLLYLHLSKSYRVKLEWKILKIDQGGQKTFQSEANASNRNSSFTPINDHFDQVFDKKNESSSRRNSLLPKSKSLYNDIKC